MVKSADVSCKEFSSLEHVSIPGLLQAQCSPPSQLGELLQQDLLAQQHPGWQPARGGGSSSRWDDRGVLAAGGCPTLSAIKSAYPLENVPVPCVSCP